MRARSVERLGFLGIAVDEGLNAAPSSVPRVISVPDVLTSPELSGFVVQILTSPGVAGALAGDAAMTLLFGAIGCFTVLRGAFREAKAAPPVV